MKMTWLFNEHHSIKTQLSVAFLSIVIVSFGVCIAIGLGFTAALGTSAYSTADDGIVKQTRTNAATDANELGASLAKDLEVVAKSVCMVASLQALILIKQIHDEAGAYVLPFSSFDSFREYDFVPGCLYPSCPKDFGGLTDRSRLNHMNGSIKHSSVYMYKSMESDGIPAGAVRNDSAWSSVLEHHSYVQPIVDSLAYQDTAFDHLYNVGYNTTVFFYLSVQVGDASSEGGYLAVHRGFPGTERNSSTYDPTSRSWFRHAPADAFYLDGPYRETFTGRYVINLSSRKTIESTTGGLILPQPSVVVAASVMLLDSLAQIIHTKVYPNEGYGVLLKRDTLEVLVWRNASEEIYNATSGHFLKLSDLEPGLSGVDVRQKGTFTYTDTSGVRWLVASSPCLLHTDHLTSASAPALVMLVFSRWDTATAALPVLHENISSTTDRIHLCTGVLAAAVVVLLVLLIAVFVTWLTAPLTEIRRILAQIIAIAAEDESRRDYSAIVAVSRFDLYRSDELGYLSTSFWYMVVQLHNANEAKKNRPKYPPNPFHIPLELWMRSEVLPSSSTDLTSLFLSPDASNLVIPGAFMDRLTRLSRPNPALEVHAVNATAEPAARSGPVTDGDVLGQLSAHYAAHDDGDLSGMEMGTMVPTVTTGIAANYACVGSSEALVAQDVAPLQLPARTCKIFTLKVYLYSLSALLLLGLVAVMGVAVYLLQTEGQGWMLEAGDSIESTEVLNLHAVAQIKSDFVKAYFKQVTVDTQVLATAFTQLLDGNLTTVPPDTYLQSYALDPTNFYSYPLANGATKTYNASGYFDVASVNCVSDTGCAPYQDSPLTQLTSLLDLQMRPYFHTGNILDFIQTGHEDEGYTRILPYSYKNYGNPTSCLIEDRTLAFCDTAYLSSPCNPAVTSGPFPAYDARCRSWYRSVAGSGSSSVNVSVDDVHFQYPRVSSGGSLVVTAVSPVRHHHSDEEALRGALNINVLAATLSTSINEFKILRSGYVYLVDAKNVSRVVIHPRLTTACTTLRCCESSFSATEYDQFLSDVLVPLQREDSSQATRAVTVLSFQKGGTTWKFAHSTVSYGTVDYILVAVVPRSEIIKASTDVEDQISDSNLGILISSCITLSVFICVILYVTNELVEGIVKPVNDLSNLCEQVVQGNLHGDSIPTQATSSDMRMLLTAFTNTMTALRFGSDSYAKGDLSAAKALFEEALLLYTTTGQVQGIGACHNNLGAVFMSLNNHNEAHLHYQKAIAIAEERVASAASASAADVITVSIQKHIQPTAAGDYAKVVPSPTSTTTTTTRRARPGLKQAQKVLSDRRGNLALLYIAQQRYADAFECLEECMEQDKQSGYIRGCVVKQGNMGHLYLKQGEVSAAERVFRSALSFVTVRRIQFFSDSWDAQEAMLARQIALFNMAQLHAHCKQYDLAVHYLLLSLSQGPVLHLNTTTQTLACLTTLLQDTGAGAPQLVSHLQSIAQVNGLSAQDVDGCMASTSAKRVAFALDYSGSMSGGKIQAAVVSLNDLFVHHLAPQDELLILKFNQICTVELPLTRKEHNEDHVSQVISSLVRPSGGTALYDAIKSSMTALYHAGGASSPTPSAKSNDWVVVLTDGQEGCSHSTKSATEDLLRNATCGFVMMGVGSDVNAAELESLVRCAIRGFYVSTSGDREGIRSAFGKVAVLIQGQVIMEDL